MEAGKKVLVAGGTGTIGVPLVKMLIERGHDVSVVSMDKPEYAKLLFGNSVKFTQLDLTDFDNCLSITKGQDHVYNLVGIKGSVGIGESKVASYFFPMILYQTYLMEASFRNSVDKYLFVSSVCAYPQMDEPKKEDQLWNGMPKQNDRYPGLVKRIGEIQGDTYLQEHGWEGVKIVRPSNVYGPYDDFNPASAQVIPALIARMLDGENPIKIWGDGSAIRDFIYTEECAYWLIEAMEKAPACTPINLGSGEASSIKLVAETIAKQMPHEQVIEWDVDKPTGDPVRILDMSKAKELIDFKLRIDLEEGIKRTIEWYSNNQDFAQQKGERYYGK